MILLVNDANILCDLLKADLIEPFFRLESEFHVSDLVFNEVREDNLTDLEALMGLDKLIKTTFEFEELVEIQHLKSQQKSLSVPDCSCLYLSGKLSATLLTGDAALRKIAQKKHIPVHGLLWVFDELVENNLISCNTALEKLNYILCINPRLPRAECRKRIAKWKKSS
jgi:predicted nucleic acid-binding protein